MRLQTQQKSRLLCERGDPEKSCERVQEETGESRNDDWEVYQNGEVHAHDSEPGFTGEVRWKEGTNRDTSTVCIDVLHTQVHTYTHRERETTCSLVYAHMRL